MKLGLQFGHGAQTEDGNTCEASGRVVEKRQIVHQTSLPPTHFHLFHGYTPSVEHLRLFGALCYPTRVTKQPKLNQTADLGRFLGCYRDLVGYLVWISRTHLIVEPSDVVFYVSGIPTVPVTQEEPFTVAEDEGGMDASDAPVTPQLAAEVAPGISTKSEPLQPHQLLHHQLLR